MKKQIFSKFNVNRINALIVSLMVTVLLAGGPAWGFNSPGLSLNIFPEDGQEDLRYILGDPIKLILVSRNETGLALYTERGFSQLEQHRFLSLIDPAGKKHFLGGEVTSGDAPPPFFIKDDIEDKIREMIPAEKLPADYENPIVIDNLTDLFPVMKTTLGWYTLEINMPFIRLYWTRQDQVLGLLGDSADAAHNWDGTLNSNKLQLQVTLAPNVNGAHFNVYVKDQNQLPVNQVPVKVFDTSAIAGLTLEDAYTTGIPVLSGTTNPDGLAIWNADLCQAQNDYTAIAYYSEEFQSVLVSQGESGWAAQCDGTIVKTISYGTAPASGTYSVFALEKLWLHTDAVINDGDVAANSAGPQALDCDLPDCIEPEVVVDQRVYAHDGVKIMGDSVLIKADASVYDVVCNELENYGTIRGQQITPLNLPLWTPPEFRESAPGAGNITVSAYQTQNLNPGAYNNIVVYYRGTLTLAAGTYHLNYFELKDDASLICNGPVEIRIKTRFECDEDNFVGPGPDSGYAARDIVFYVGGTDEASDEPAVEIDRRSIIKANFYAPNGTVYVENDSQLEGSFLGKVVEIGASTTVSLDSAFADLSSPCDFDSDGDFDGLDLFAFQLAYSQNALTADVNKDGTVGPADVEEFATHFGTGTTSAPPPPLQALTAGALLDNETAQADKRSKRPRFKSKKNRKTDTTRTVSENKTEKNKKKQFKNRRKREK